MANLRQRARILALQALYEADTAHHDAGGSLERLLVESKLQAAGQELARVLVRTVAEHRPAIDETIRTAAPLWPLEQIATVDRNILRIAIAELSYLRGTSEVVVPAPVAINEAVDLGKTFGTESSPRFINGVLGTVLGRSQALAAIEAP